MPVLPIFAQVFDCSNICGIPACTISHMCMLGIVTAGLYCTLTQKADITLNKFIRFAITNIIITIILVIAFAKYMSLYTTHLIF